MATFAIGDIHGCWNALESLLDCVPISAEDRLILLGDYVDRGPDSARVLEWVMHRSQSGHVVALRGNHELMMQQAIERQFPLQHWLSCGGEETLASYQAAGYGRSLSPELVPPAHHLFIKNRLRPYFETDTHIFVHACVDAAVPLDEQDEHTLYWDSFEFIAPHPSGKVVVCGHTAQKSGLPANRGHAICLDTWVYGSGWLTCLNLETGEYWQANQKSKTRFAQLDDFP